ncbi:PREDICTED: cytochrome P450 2B4-like isoform X1 [Priapulus caudatus]|uniref:Cytochrome P450 2B4-like isoform X1 n=1 Tax=Priapulus caudatus TaxID=37621 RepID=A0ABM1E094_PRICU|nr:PREDICTED: cytochrome P450 2B4-like isoform X1 [Priapulus caudatus]
MDASVIWNFLLGKPVGLLLGIASVFLYVYMTRKPSGIPPGPAGWPVFGNLLRLGRNPHLTLTSMSQQYGNIFSVYMGNMLTVVLNDYDTVKEAFLKMGDVFSGRPDLYVIKTSSSDHNGVHGLILTEGAHWREQRKFALEALREFGMGKISLEGKIQEEVQALLHEIGEKSDQAFDSKLLMGNAVSNVICNIVFGNRFDYDDAEFREMLERLNISVRNSSVSGLINFMPFLRFVPGLGRELMQGFAARRVKSFAYFQRRIDEHKATLDREHVRDFIDAYLKHIEDVKTAKRGGETFTETELIFAIGSLFGAGTETTATTLRWGFVYMINYPDVQRKVQAEIDAVIGDARLPSMKDRPLLPYTEATIMEIQRLGQLVPLGVPHATTRDVSLRGYTIPARTMILPNLWAIHRDAKNFPDPTAFKPERYLDADGSLSSKLCERLMPFSIGWRVCLGEMLARMELLLFFTAILQQFHIQTPEGESPPPLTGEMGIVHQPTAYRQRFIPRK